MAVAALVLAAGVAGCKEKESLVVVTLSTSTGDTTLATVSISVGTHAASFPLDHGVPSTGISFGVYVPSSITGQQPIDVIASPPAAGGCNGEVGSGTVNIKTAGETFGPIAIPLTPSTSACPMGGHTGTGGTGTGTGGAVGTGGAAGAGGKGTGGAAGAGGKGTGGAAGSSLGGSAGGHPGTGGGAAGAPGTGGTGGTPHGGITACYEYDHSDSGQCANSSCTKDYGVWGAAFSPVNPSLAVTSGTDGRVKVWTVSNGTMTAEGHSVTGGSGRNVVAFSPDGTLLAIGQTGGIQIVSVATWAPVRTLTVASTVVGVGFSPDGTQVISVDTQHDDFSSTTSPGHLYAHAVTNITAQYSVAVNDAYSLGISPVPAVSGLPLAVTTKTGSALVYLLTTTGFSTPTTLAVTADQSYAETARFSPNGGMLAAGGDDGLLQFWPFPLTGATQGTPIDVYSITSGTSEWVDVVAFSPDGSELALGAGYYGSVTTYATATRSRVGVEQDTSMVYDVLSLGYSSNGQYIIGGESNCGCVFLCLH
jgi:hypothetical protein